MPNSLAGLDLSAFERLLTDISARFVNAAPTRVDAEITGALRALVEFLDVDRSTLLQWSADGRYLEITHHWVVAGYEPVPQFIPQQALPYLFRKTLEGKPSPTRALLNFHQRRRSTASSSRRTAQSRSCRSHWSREDPPWV